MFRHELSRFLKDVLDAVERSPHGVGIGPDLLPDMDHVDRIAAEIAAEPEDVLTALLGLQAAHCLVESGLEIEGIDSAWWTVHPQCVP